MERSSQLIGSGGHRILVLVVAEDSIFRQLLVYQNATVIDFLVHLVELHLLCRNRMVPQLISDLTLCIHIPDAICFEPYPFLRLVLWAVPGSAAVHLVAYTAWKRTEPGQRPLSASSAVCSAPHRHHPVKGAEPALRTGLRYDCHAVGEGRCPRYLEIHVRSKGGVE